MSAESKVNLFDELQGEQLSAVTFVQDYLQLSFDGPVLNIFNPLTVESGDTKITSWASGFRDALCAQITKIVAFVEFIEGEAFIITFEDKSRLSVSLQAEDYSTPEAICGHGFKNNQWLVIN